MNKRMTAYIIGVLLLAEAALMLLPACVALYYGEWPCVSAYVFTASLLAAVSYFLIRLRVSTRTIYSREGLVAVALGWAVLSLGGSLPFVFSGEIPSFLDAFFETVSGFTTTGASILPRVEDLSRANLFWRSFTHWVGGMGVLVFVMMTQSLSSGGGDIHLMRSESTGPAVSKLVPRSRATAKYLYSIYFVITLLGIVLLLTAGNPVFDSLLLTFGAVGTGGFGILSSSVADYNTATQIILSVIMILCGVNFGCYYLILTKRAKEAFRNEELRVYLGVMLAAIVVVTVNIVGMFDSVGEALKHALFQVSSVMTTTGYSSADFNLWPELSRTVLLAVMIIGGCAGSTGGGMKVSRVIILFKEGYRQMKKSISPNRVEVVRFNGKRVPAELVNGIAGFLILYVMIFIGSLLLISLDGFDTTTNFTAVIATLNNIGPGLGMVGPAGSFAAYSSLSKLVLIFNMLAGRLEILPLLAMMMPRTWRK
jgi:trk system potassium uptake protein TrkH